MDEGINQKETNACKSEVDLLKNSSLEDFLEEDLEDMEEEKNREEQTSAYNLEETMRGPFTGERPHR